MALVALSLPDCEGDEAFARRELADELAVTKLALTEVPSGRSIRRFAFTAVDDRGERCGGEVEVEPIGKQRSTRRTHVIFTTCHRWSGSP